MIFSAGPGRVLVDEDGVVVGVRHGSRPDDSYLQRAGLVRLELHGELLRWPSVDVQHDNDEVEVAWQIDGCLRATFRHTFTAGWGMRLAFSNLATVPLALDRVVLSLQVAPGHCAWALAAGSEAAFSVQRDDGSGPVLGGVLTLGSINRIDSDGVHLDRIELPPGGRYVVSWQWEWFTNPWAFGRNRHPGVPKSLFLITEEPTRITVSSDLAVMAPGLEVINDETEEFAEFVAHRPGLYSVDLRSSAGSVAYQLSAANPADGVLATFADRLLNGSRTPAGVPRVEEAAAGLILRHALTRGLVDQRDEAADALDRLTARLSEGTRPEPFVAAYLAGEAVATGDRDVLGIAAADLLDGWGPAAGLGVALLRLRAGSLVLGTSIGRVLEHARSIAVTVNATRKEQDGIDLDGMIGRDLDELELLSVLASPRSVAPDAGVVGRVARLGTRLGGGLKGVAVEPMPLVRLAQFAVVFGLLPERLETAFQRRWLCSPGELARRARTEVLNRCGHDAADSAIWPAAWLALDQSTAG